MPAIVIGAILGGAAYLCVSLLLLIYVTIPLTLIGIWLGVAAGIGHALVIATRVLVNLDPIVKVLRPGQVAAGALGGRKHPSLPRRDSAWPQFFVGQLPLDIAAMWSRGFWQHARLWTFFADLRNGPRWIGYGVAWPFTIIGGVTLGFFSAATVAGLAAVTVLAVAVALAAELVIGVFGAGLRGVDRLFQLVFRSSAGCPRCYRVSPLPAYHCAGCARLHRDLRPNLLGVLRHRCECGTSLPTTRIRAGLRLRPVCQYCERDLHDGAGRHTDVRIPVFGASSSGKTRFIMAAFVSLKSAIDTTGNGTRIRPADPDSERAFAGFDRDLDPGNDIPATQEQLPTALTAQISTPGRKLNTESLLHLFDAAGEYSQDRHINEELAYLDYARTLVFVLDPFSIRSVSDSLEQTHPEVLSHANPSRHDPIDSYSVTAQRLRQFQVDLKRRKLAFVISKADLLTGLPVAEGLTATDRSVRDWLVEQDLHNLVSAADRDFGEVRYYLVSSQRESRGRATDALHPLRWLLRHDRVPLPAPPNSLEST